MSLALRLRVLGIGLAGFVWVLPAHANPDCPILVVPAEGHAAWQEKAGQAKAVFLDKRDHDCRSVRIDVQREGNALLTFTTSDGRIAVRVLHAPEDIEPTLEALLVTLPVEAPLEVTGREGAGERVESRRQIESTKPVIVEKPSLRVGHRMLFEGFTGARFGIDSGFFAPSFGVRATNYFAPWEIGVGGEWNPLYVPVGISAPPNYSMWSFEANLFVGRRKSFDRWDLPYGFSMGIAAVRAEMDLDPVTKGQIDLQAVQPRVGGFGGFVYPRTGTLRLRGGLNFDVVLFGARSAGTEKKGLPALPRFGLGMSLGLEIAP